MRYGLIGEHLAHSFSPDIHRTIGNYDYQLRELAPDKLDDFLTRHEFTGINVTIPYKQAVIPYLTGIDEQARAIGAVNTIVNRQGILYGYNTDFAGMRAMLTHAGITVSGKKVLILGSGGTSHTAHAVADSLGAASIITVSRHPAENTVSYEDAARLHADAQIILNTTPCGMFPRMDDYPLDLSKFGQLSGVADVIYNPLRTRLTLEAQRRGIPTVNGLYMLIAQAIYASGHFFDREPETADIDRIYRQLAEKKENIVLIGMPASGKSTIGKCLAHLTGRPFFDLDNEIVRHTGKDIPTIFREQQESGFRNIETAVLRQQLAPLTGCVFAVGGGTVLREENVRLLRHNGKLYFLDRSPEKLVPTADRPLASSVEAIQQRYRERYPIYTAAADVVIDGNGTVEATAQRIMEDRQA